MGDLGMVGTVKSFITSYLKKYESVLITPRSVRVISILCNIVDYCIIYHENLNK